METYNFFKQYLMCVLVSNLEDDSVALANVGTTAEVLAVKEDVDELSGIAVTRIKAIGRQRFRVISTTRQLAGSDSLLSLIGIVGGTASVKWYDVHLSNCLSVPSFNHSSGMWQVCCWAPYGQEIWGQRQVLGAQQRQHCTTGLQHGTQQQMRPVPFWQPSWHGRTQTRYFSAL